MSIPTIMANTKLEKNTLSNPTPGSIRIFAVASRIKRNHITETTKATFRNNRASRSKYKRMLLPKSTIVMPTTNKSMNPLTKKADTFGRTLSQPAKSGVGGVTLTLALDIPK